MMYILDLLNKIKWDKNLNPNEYSIIYLDFAQKKEIKFTEIKEFNNLTLIIESENKEVEIPLHRIREITKYQLFTLLAFSLIFLAFYFGIENYNLDRENYYHPMLSFENSIPKISFFVIFYLLAYSLGILPFILIK